MGKQSSFGAPARTMRWMRLLKVVDKQRHFGGWPLMSHIHFCHLICLRGSAHRRALSRTLRTHRQTRPSNNNNNATTTTTITSSRSSTTAIVLLRCFSAQPQADSPPAFSLLSGSERASFRKAPDRKWRLANSSGEWWTQLAPLSRRLVCGRALFWA